MDYKKLYNKIISNRKSKIPVGYKEKHHILPKSLGGLDVPENLVFLTAREHFICHYLLTKMFPEGSNNWYRMCQAFMMMKPSSSNQKRYFNSRLYESKRQAFSSAMSEKQSGSKNSQHGTKWIHNKSLKQNKRIDKFSAIPEGWTQGRVLKWELTKKNCKICNKEYVPITKELFCSEECKKTPKSKLYGRETEFIDIYNKTGSISKSLKIMGFPGAVSHYYYWAKKLLEVNNNAKV